jgi:hypothetical protein
LDPFLLLNVEKRITHIRLAVASTFVPHVAILLESTDGVNREISFPTSSAWEKLPDHMETSFHKYAARQGTGEEIIN